MAQALLKNDYVIEARVRREIRCGADVDDSDIVVEVGDQVVSLGGTVRLYADKLAAGEAALRVPCVTRVVNRIRVKRSPFGFPADMEIADAVRHTFEWNVFVPEKHVAVVVEDGWVVLKGEVSCPRERQEAESVLAHVKGVRGILNKIQVHTPAYR